MKTEPSFGKTIPVFAKIDVFQTVLVSRTQKVYTNSRNYKKTFVHFS